MISDKINNLPRECQNHMVFDNPEPTSAFRVRCDPGKIPRGTANRLRRRPLLRVADYTSTGRWSGFARATFMRAHPPC
jgi:hypothetical protein